MLYIQHIRRNRLLTSSRERDGGCGVYSSVLVPIERTQQNKSQPAPFHSRNKPRCLFFCSDCSYVNPSRKNRWVQHFHFTVHRFASQLNRTEAVGKLFCCSESHSSRTSEQTHTPPSGWLYKLSVHSYSPRTQQNHQFSEKFPRNSAVGVAFSASRWV